VPARQTENATIVRRILVPAAMQLLDDWNWWLPKWLDRLLPDLDVESGSSGGGGSGAEPAKA
jgi:putative drug exporter of the RND superfamily